MGNPIESTSCTVPFFGQISSSKPFASKALLVVRPFIFLVGALFYACHFVYEKFDGFLKDKLIPSVTPSNEDQDIVQQAKTLFLINGNPIAVKKDLNGTVITFSLIQGGFEALFIRIRQLFTDSQTPEILLHFFHDIPLVHSYINDEKLSSIYSKKILSLKQSDVSSFCTELCKYIKILQRALLYNKKSRDKENIIGPFAVKLEDMAEKIKDFSEFKSLARNLIEKEDVREEVIAYVKKDLSPNFTNEIFWEKVDNWKKTHNNRQSLCQRIISGYLELLKDLFPQSLSSFQTTTLEGIKVNVLGKIKTEIFTSNLSEEQKQQLVQALDLQQTCENLQDPLFV